ncbi:MAG: tRNA lysidine(34) synthetase TilS [Rhodocyclaceae bacterium]|nr:tRNA lysidine(34) synthetase TilS [Rhodocyclaceae bacterium]
MGHALATLDASSVPIVVAYSGGMDSTVLLHATKAFCAETRRKVAALHVNHGLSSNSFQWEAFCRRQCADWGVPLTVKRVRVLAQTGRGVEAAAREARYKVLGLARAATVLLAHHAGDQAETILFNLCRGSGMRGGAAMRPERDRYRRPFLALDKPCIESYANANGLQWIHDESNDDVSLTRNFLRQEILPRLERSIPGASRNLCAAAARFGEAAALLDELARIDLADPEGSFPISRSRFLALSESRARNALRYLLDRAGVGIPGEDRLREAVRQLISAAPDRHPMVHFGEWRLRCSKGVISLRREP